MGEGDRNFQGLCKAPVEGTLSLSSCTCYMEQCSVSSPQNERSEKCLVDIVVCVLLDKISSVNISINIYCDACPYFSCTVSVSIHCCGGTELHCLYYWGTGTQCFILYTLSMSMVHICCSFFPYSHACLRPWCLCLFKIVLVGIDMKLTCALRTIIACGSQCKKTEKPLSLLQ